MERQRSCSRLIKSRLKSEIRFEFHFHAKNHTVTQSSFAEPCTRQRNTVTNELGADSGFMPVAADAKEIPVWTIQIKQDNAPIWMFCNQGNHCNSGMVFAINAPQDGEKSFNVWKDKAKAAKHPNPDDHITADFTPPSNGPSGNAPPPAGNNAPTGSNNGPAPAQSSSGASAPAPSGSAPPSGSASAVPTTGSAAVPTARPSADQANASPAPSASTKPSGALSTARVPGAGIALTLAGLLVGMLL